MKLADLLQSGEDTKLILDEARLIRISLQSIAESLARATAIPEPVIPDHPLGPEGVGEYGVSIQDMEDEDAAAIRDRLRASGLTDSRIEEQLVSFLTGQEEE